MLGRLAGYTSTLLVRGVEGAIAPSLRQGAAVYHAAGEPEPEPLVVDPVSLGIDKRRARPAAGRRRRRPRRAGRGCRTRCPGRRARADPRRLVLAGALCLWHAGLADSAPAGAACARQAIDSGAALERLEAARLEQARR